MICMKTMRIAIDVDDVITEAPEFFAAMTRAMRAAGHEIHIVTDFDERFRSQREKELADYGVVYDTLAITAQKSAYCKDHDIDFALDDDRSYFREGPAPATINLFRLVD
jgi:uncharacterized HAD superfamily protein